jgi:hypothetical protein
MYYASGNVYQGQWSQNMKCGHGRMIWKNGTEEEYIGEWKDNKPNGQGEYIWRKMGQRGHQFPFLNRYVGKK